MKQEQEMSKINYLPLYLNLEKGKQDKCKVEGVQ